MPVTGERLQGDPEELNVDVREAAIRKVGKVPARWLAAMRRAYAQGAMDCAAGLHGWPAARAEDRERILRQKMRGLK